MGLMDSIQKKMLSHFGATKNPREAGYILNDGTMLDLSGRHYATGYSNSKPLPGQPDYLKNARAVDHRELPEGLDLQAVQEQGNAIRFSDIGGDLHIELTKGQNITPDQWAALKRAHSREEGSIIYDITDRSGYTLDSGEISSINKLMNISKKYLPVGLMGAFSLYSPQNAQALQYRNMAEQQSLQEPTFDPTTLLAGPARWGGGLMNMIGDTLFKGAGRVGINTESGI
jgi:hypothetical protein